MKYTTIAGKKLSNMSLGTVQLGMNYGIANDAGKPELSKSFDMLSAALESGITSLDTARGYGDAEDVLGQYFKSGRYTGEMPFLTTKFSTNLPAGTPAAEVEKAIFTSVETSLEKLGVKKVNCILLHAADDMTKHGDIVPKTLEKLTAKGYTDICGVSIYFPNEVETMLQNDVYQAIQVPMSLFDQKLIHGGYIQRLADKKACVFVRSVFLQGLFFLDPEKITDPDLIKYAAPHIRQLREFCQHEGMSIAQFAISFIRDVPGVTSLVLGSDTPAQVKENIALLDGPAISEGTRAKAAEIFQTVDLDSIMTVLRRPKPQK